MSLIGFHKVLIVSGILFCLGFGGWRVRAYAGSGGTADLVVAAVSLLAAAALAGYLAMLGRILGRRER